MSVTEEDLPGVTPTYSEGWIITTTTDHPEGPGLFWRPGHRGNKYYNAVRGVWELPKGKIYWHKNRAISKCGDLNREERNSYSHRPYCVVKIILQATNEIVYPPKLANP